MVQVKKPELRTAILLAARREFLERGFRNASMRSIARGAGCSVGNLYSYFASKDSLFTAVVEPRWEAVSRALEEATPRQHNGLRACMSYEEEYTRLRHVTEILHRNRDDFALILIKSEDSSASRYRHEFVSRMREDMHAMAEMYRRTIPGASERHISDFFMDSLSDFHWTTLTRFLEEDFTLEEMCRYLSELMTYGHYGFRALFEKLK